MLTMRASCLMGHEGERAGDVALEDEGEALGLLLGLLVEHLPEVHERGRLSSLAALAVVGELDAAGDHRALLLGERAPALVAQGRRCRQHRVDLPGLGLRPGHVRGGDVAHVEDVDGQLCRGADPDPVRALVRRHEQAVLAGGVEDVDLVARVGKDGLLDLALDGEGLARPRHAADDAVGGQQRRAVDQDHVSRRGLHAVVASALHVEALRDKGHELRELARQEVAPHVDAVEAKGQHRVHALLLAVGQGVELDAGGVRGAHDLRDALVQLLG